MGKWVKLTGWSSLTGDGGECACMHKTMRTHTHTYTPGFGCIEHSVAYSVSPLSPCPLRSLELALPGSGSEASGQSGPLS